MDIAPLRRDLEGLRIEDNAKIVQQKSRDFYWYSPLLKRQLTYVRDCVNSSGKVCGASRSTPEV